MNETLIGVIVGGLIASVSPFIIWIASNRQWKKERNIERLREKRAELLSAFNTVNNKMGELFDLLKQTADQDLTFEEVNKVALIPGQTIFTLPDEVKNSYVGFTALVYKQSEKRFDKGFELTSMMARYLQEIDDEIDQLLR